MKFAKQLSLRSIPKWADDYINYKELKGKIKEQSAPTKDDTYNSFKKNVLIELDKVESFYAEKENEAKAKLTELQNRWSDDLTEEERKEWANEISNLLVLLEGLADYSQTNISGFKKILKKYDKINNATISEEVWPIVTNSRFVKSEMDEYLLLQAKLLWRKKIPSNVIPQPENIGNVHDCELSVYDSLDVNIFPWGAISRFWVTISEDGMGGPIKVPVIVAKGVKQGPTVGITAALHGNELNGIPLIHRLFTEIKCSDLHGIVVAVPIANVPGYLCSQRGFSDGSDLNRLMPGKKNGTAAQVYAYHFMKRIVSKFNYLIDLHTASKGRMNSLYVRADMLDPVIKRMALLQNPQLIIVHNKSPDGSLRGAAIQLGIPSITVEIGDPSKFQKRFVKNALIGVSNILCNLKMIPQEPDLPDFDPVVCARSYWIFSECGGILSVIPDVNTWVKRGEVIAFIHSVFGNLEKTYYAPEDGIIIGKSADPVCSTGSRVLHLGVVESEYARKTDDGHL